MEPCDFQGLPASKVPTSLPFPAQAFTLQPRLPRCPPLGPGRVALPAAAGLILGGLPLAEGSSRDAHLWSRTTGAGRPAWGTARRLRKGELGVQESLACLPACLLEETALEV